MSFPHGDQKSHGTDGSKVLCIGRILQMYIANTAGLVYNYFQEKLSSSNPTAGTSTNSYTIDFIYDQSGRPYAFMYGNVYYYYITNLQGDVMSILYGFYRSLMT